MQLCTWSSVCIHVQSVFSAFVSSGTLTWSVEARGWCQVSSLITFHFRFRTGLLQTQVSQILLDSLPIKPLGSPPFPSPELSWSQRGTTTPGFLLWDGVSEQKSWLLSKSYTNDGKSLSYQKLLEIEIISI